MAKWRKDAESSRGRSLKPSSCFTVNLPFSGVQVKSRFTHFSCFVYVSHILYKQTRRDCVSFILCVTHSAHDSFQRQGLKPTITSKEIQAFFLFFFPPYFIPPAAYTYQRGAHASYISTYKRQLRVLLAALYGKLSAWCRRVRRWVENKWGGTYDALLTQLQSYIAGFFSASFGGRMTALVPPFYFIYFMDGISLVRNTEQQLCFQ